jgi:hypothetical protein
MWTIGRQAGLRRDTDFMAGKTAVSARTIADRATYMYDAHNP